MQMYEISNSGELHLPDISNDREMLHHLLDFVDPVVADFQGVFLELLILNHMKHSQGHCTGNRVTTILK